MRVIYKFGQFRMWGEIEDGRVGTPVYMVHPMGRLSIQTTGEPMAFSETSAKRMVFDYKQRLDHDLVEYEFIEEENNK